MKIADIKQEQFDAKLWELFHALSDAQREAIPGIYEVIVEELNNAVIDDLINDD
jgi:hypothetical protein